MKTDEYKEGFHTIYTHKKVYSCEIRGNRFKKVWRKTNRKSYLFWSKNQDNIFLHTDRFFLIIFWFCEIIRFIKGLKRVKKFKEKTEKAIYPEKTNHKTIYIDRFHLYYILISVKSSVLSRYIKTHIFIIVIFIYFMNILQNYQNFFL